MIGSGIGGISAAALLAKAGRDVLVVEQGEGVGGYARSFRRGGFVFDPAVHVFAQGHPGALPEALFEYLGVGDRVRFIPVASNYKAVFPDLEIETPFDLDGFIERHQQLFPGEKAGIDRFFRLCRQVHKEAHELPPQLGLDTLDAAARRLPVLFRYLRSTVADVLDELLEDPRLKGVASVCWPYLGSPPARLSFVTFSTILSVFLEGGFYCEGGFQAIPKALAEAFEHEGGEIVLGRGATRVPVEEGRVAGVELEGGTRVRAPVVVSNADATATFEELIGEAHLPAGFMRRLRRMRPSWSAVVVFVATDLDLTDQGAHEIFRPRSFDPEEVHRDILAGRPGGTWGTVPTLVDPSLAPAGQHTLTITCMAPYDIGRPWQEEVEPFTGRVLDDFEVVFPGLRDRVTFLETATPPTLQRYCLNRDGAAYGWENTPAQSGGRRSPHVTPLEGLYLSGHWTQPGTGSLRVLVSGMHTAQLVLVRTGSSPLDFEHPDFPPPD